MCFLNLLNCLHHWLLQPFFFLPFSNTLYFLWLGRCTNEWLILVTFYFFCNTHFVLLSPSKTYSVKFPIGTWFWIITLIKETYVQSFLEKNSFTFTYGLLKLKNRD
jgi:hypothetical protein